MTKAQKHMGIIASLGCVICRREYKIIEPCEVHHIAEGSGLRSDYMTAGLCFYHHKNELHGGIKTFLRRYNLPTEYHLMELVNRYRIEDNV